MLQTILGAFGYIIGTLFGAYLDHEVSKTEWGKKAKNQINKGPVRLHLAGEPREPEEPEEPAEL
jgi:hypothetical protein